MRASYRRSRYRREDRVRVREEVFSGFAGCGGVVEALGLGGYVKVRVESPDPLASDSALWYHDEELEPYPGDAR